MNNDKMGATITALLALTAIDIATGIDDGQERDAVIGNLFDDDVSGEEIIGLDTIVGEMGAIGEELDSILDSVVSGTMAGSTGVSKIRQLAANMKELRQVDPNAVAITKQSPNRRRYWHAPFPATAFLAAATTTLQMQPQELFRTERLFIPSALAQDYNVTQLFVGQKNQLLVAGEINGQVFSEVAVRSFLNLDTANVGNTINLTLRNDGVGTSTPRPDLLGTAAV